MTTDNQPSNPSSSSRQAAGSVEQGDFIRRAQAMLVAYPLFDVPRPEWVEVCTGLLGTIAAVRESDQQEIIALKAVVASQSATIQRQYEDYRQEIERLQAEVAAWKAGAMADATGHMFRCAKVNGVWQCAKGCAVAALSVLRESKKEEK